MLKDVKEKDKLVKIIGIIVFFSCVGILIPSNHFNGLENEAILDRIVNRFYFTFTTISTVGYGDISPKSNIAKLYGASMMMTLLYTAIF
jgi:hypothetical protein